MGYMRSKTGLLSVIVGNDPTHEPWPFYYDRAQQALLSQIREAWGQDCMIQIVGGRWRIFSELGNLEFFGNIEVSGGIAARPIERSLCVEVVEE